MTIGALLGLQKGIQSFGDRSPFIIIIIICVLSPSYIGNLELVIPFMWVMCIGRIKTLYNCNLSIICIFKKKKKKRKEKRVSDFGDGLLNCESKTMQTKHMPMPYEYNRWPWKLQIPLACMPDATPTCLAQTTFNSNIAFLFIFPSRKFAPQFNLHLPATKQE